MNKLIVLSLSLLFSAALSAQTQSIKLNPFAYTSGATDLLQYERVIGANSTMGLNAGYSKYTRDDQTNTYFGGGIQYRYYFSEVLRKWYILGSFDYGTGEAETTGTETDTNGNETPFDVKADVQVYGPSVRVGYQWLFGSGFTIDLNLGLGYYNIAVDTEVENEDFFGLSGNLPLPSGSIGLGYTF